MRMKELFKSPDMNRAKNWVQHDSKVSMKMQL